MRTMKNYGKVVPALLIALFALSCDTEQADAPAPLVRLSIDEAGGDAEQNKVLAEVRRATARYHRVAAAEEDGYMLTSPCVATEIGGMGHHYLNIANLQDGVVDPSRPEVLVYEPRKNGTMKLVAVEFMVLAEPWDAVNDDPPMLGSQEFEDHRNPNPGEPPFPHYQLHAWVWQHNPLGMHAPFNPTVTCDFEVQE
ncbi:hypothetical protein WG947_07935 [Pontibacter sp. H259]|uniref:hypothetical protein n=1 Tax=Pontibacter sp. H259 TaxID=3133421 RepID=UPI0030C0E419